MSDLETRHKALAAALTLHEGNPEASPDEIVRAAQVFEAYLGKGEVPPEAKDDEESENHQD